MRIKLFEGKQTELINLAKQNKTWSQLSKILNLSENYLRNELRKEKTLLSKETYKKLCKIARDNYNPYIMKKLHDNWGRSKGGKNSADGLTKKIKIPEDSEELAEFYGIMLGDGNLNKIKAYKVATYQVRITGDSRYDKGYLLNYVKPLIEKLFDISVKTYKAKTINELFIKAHGRNLVEFLESKGFKPGNKIKNRLIMPKWIKNNPRFLKVCIRGIYDTDGGIYKLNNQNTYQIALTNHNKSLLNDVRNSLIKTGINPSRIIHKRKFYITKKSELRKFLKDIGFRNPKHTNKIEMWKSALWSSGQ